jgi:phosphatidylethanolamine/phosphatidyl-N-methylethanolamine N-methyltransferase
MPDQTSRSDNTNPQAIHDTSNSSSRRGYRLFAPVYDYVFGLSLQHGRRLAIAALDASPGERILEVGVGSGMSLPMYPGQVSVIGIDISREMLRKARRRVDRRNLSPSQTLLQMDAEHMAFTEASFDKAVVMYAVAGFADPARALAEVQRVCKYGATLVIVNHFLSERPISRFFDILLAPIYRLLEYRADLDIDTFLNDANLELLDRKPANLFGYSTVLVCRSNGPRRHEPRPAPASVELDDARISAAQS